MGYIKDLWYRYTHGYPLTKEEWDYIMEYEEKYGQIVCDNCGEN